MFANQGLTNFFHPIGPAHRKEISLGRNSGVCIQFWEIEAQKGASFCREVKAISLTSQCHINSPGPCKFSISKTGAQFKVNVQILVPTLQNSKLILEP